jgi:hypothetical protein
MATRTDDDVSFHVMAPRGIDDYHTGMKTYFAGEGGTSDAAPRTIWGFDFFV